MDYPKILREGEYKFVDIQELKSKACVFEDLVPLQLSELYEIEHPESVLTEETQEEKESYIRSKTKEEELYGDWVFYPWSSTLLHVVPEKDYLTILTTRNKNIITEEEQHKLYKGVVGFAGLSVGSGIAATLVHMGVCKNIKLSDFDVFDTSNLNRVRTGLPQLGKKKLDVLAQELFEVNPYLNIIPFEDGINSKNVDEFVAGAPKTNVIFEIIDDFKMKVMLRVKAKEQRSALIMLTNLGDSVLVDIERYDLEANTPIFNGRIDDVTDQILAGEISKEDEKKYAIGIVGPENIPSRVLDSVKQIGVTLVGRPQLASTVGVSSGIGAYFVRQILLGEDLKSGRQLVRFGDFKTQ